jgi:hypothetical protein
LDDPTLGGQTNGNYWIRTHPADGCNVFNNGSFDSTASPSEPFDVRTAFVHYKAANGSAGTAALPSANVPEERCSKSCVDELTSKLKPVVPWTVDKKSMNNVTESTFLPVFEKTPDLTLGAKGQYMHWMLRMEPGTEASIAQKTGKNFTFHNPLWLNFSNPTIINLDTAKDDTNYALVNCKSDGRYPVYHLRLRH